VSTQILCVFLVALSSRKQCWRKASAVAGALAASRWPKKRGDETFLFFFFHSRKEMSCETENQVENSTT
jgi:hypothetical protein